MILKNLMTIICVAVFIFYSQQPAEAGTGKRIGLRVAKYGACVPVAIVSFCHGFVPSVVYVSACALVRKINKIIEADLKADQPAEPAK